MIKDPVPSSSGTIPIITGDVSSGQELSLSKQALSVKRALDLSVSLTALLIFAPIMLIAVAAICINSPGSPLFIQKRIGRNGKSFSMIKLRTMVPGAHLNHQPLLQKKKVDSRVFPVGRFLRRTSIDELPNLLNVLIGDMSIVGPRPMLENEIDLCMERHGKRAVKERLLVKPGITGLWQVSGRSNLDFDERVALDIQYASTWSLAGDLEIMMKTIPVLLQSRGAF